MTPEEVNRIIAEKVMDWRQIQGWAMWWFPVKEPVPLDDAVTDWDPYHRIEHAMMALEKFLSWEVRRYSRNDYRCRINDDELIEGDMADTPQAAICLALVEAVQAMGQPKMGSDLSSAGRPL